MIRRHHRVNLFRKYLIYSQASRAVIPLQDLTAAMNNDIPDLVEKGYPLIIPLGLPLKKQIIEPLGLLMAPFSSVSVFLMFRASGASWSLDTPKMQSSC